MELAQPSFGGGESGFLVKQSDEARGATVWGEAFGQLGRRAAQTPVRSISADESAAFGLFGGDIFVEDSGVIVDALDEFAVTLPCLV